MAYPVWRSYKVVEAKKFDDELIRWLVYWLLYSATCKAEDFGILRVVQYLDAQILYGVLRILFFSWLMHPKYQGSLLLYVKWLEPAYTREKPRIEAWVKEKVDEGLQWTGKIDKKVIEVISKKK